MSILTKIINAVIIILSLTMGFFFMFVGVVKLTPALNEDTHEELVSSIGLLTFIMIRDRHRQLPSSRFLERCYTTPLKKESSRHRYRKMKRVYRYCYLCCYCANAVSVEISSTAAQLQEQVV